MAREIVNDRWGNEIYLTDERWAHILETHDEMMNYRPQVLMTVRAGQRRQDPFDPTKYKYSGAPRPYGRGTSPHASSGGTLRSEPSSAKATEGTRLAFIHGLTPVAFCEGG